MSGSLWSEARASALLTIGAREILQGADMSELNPSRTIEELKELRRLTGDENGAQRVAFTAIWAKARSWLAGKARELGAEIERDEAGNLWATLRGESEKALLIGGHIDSVPNGGWLDGCSERAGRRGDSAADQRAIRRQAAGHRAAGRLGRRRRRAVWQESVRLVGVLGQSRHGRGARPEGQGRHHACPTRSRSTGSISST